MRDLSILLVHLGATLAQLTGPNATPADDESKGAVDFPSTACHHWTHGPSGSPRRLPKGSYARFGSSSARASKNLIRTVCVPIGGPGPAHDHQRRHGRRALCGSRRSVGVLRTFLRPPRQRARSSGTGHPWLRSGRLSMVAVMQAAHVRPRFLMTSPGAAGSTARLTGGSLPNARCVRQCW